jgi:predicted nucleic acid-binding protein
MPQNPNGIILDTCVILNLLYGDILNEFSSIFSEVSITKYSKEKELLFLKNSKDYQDETSFRNLNILFPNEFESELVLDLNIKVDAGEAHAMALALSREMDFATDDKKAIRIFKSYGNSKKVWTTPELLFYQFQENYNEEVIKSVVQKIKNYAKYIPSSSNEYYSWWIKFLE